MSTEFKENCSMVQKTALGVCILWIGLMATAWAQPGKKKSAKNRLQDSQAKVDTLRARLQQSTGLDAQLPALAPSVSLPGGKGKAESLSKLLGETIPDLGLKAKEFKSRRSERRQKAKKGRLARVQYEGIPMDNVQVKFGSGDRATIEDFHVLKEYQPISQYVMREKSWYDPKKKVRSASEIKDKERALPLHGPYKRYVAGNLIEEGYYYMGTKDGRWVTYDAKYNLLDKTHWYRGFPANSRITYYDSAHTKIKEVIPIQYDKIDGDYYSFYDEGQLKAFGRYQQGEKVGRWIEYYQYRRQRKKETQYPKSRWDENFEPFVLREWDDKGKVLYDYTKDPRASAEVDDQN
jgi:antitoxin component YwqK of YwqJK toxin-antitoxin module